MEDQTFYSLDEFHSFVTYQSAAELENPNDKSVSMIAQSEQSKPDKSLCLEEDIQCLRFNDEPADLQALQYNIDGLAKHQLTLQTKLERFGQFLSQSTQRRDFLGNELKMPAVDSISLETYNSLQVELKQTQSLLKSQQIRLQQIILDNKPVASTIQPIQIKKSLQKGSIKPESQPVARNLPSQSFSLETNLHYNNQPHFIVFKLCSLSQSSQTLYSDNNITVKYSKIQSGIAIDLEGKQNYRLRVGTLNSSHIEIPWSRFAKGKFVQNCEILDSKGSIISVPIPLPLSFIFEQRLTHYHRNAKYLKLREMMVISEITIKFYDLKVWKVLLESPELFKFERYGQTLRHAINLKGNRQIFSVEMELVKSQLRITIGHKAGSSNLRDLLEFYSFVMSQ